MTNDIGILSKVIPDIMQILKNSKVDSCSVRVMTTLKDERGGGNPRHEEGITFRNVSGTYDVDHTSEGNTLIFAIASLKKIFIALALSLALKDLEDEDDKLWNTTFTDLFNKHSVSSNLRKLPGDPTVKDLLVHRHGVPDLNDLLLAPDGSPLLSKKRFLQIISDLYANARFDPSDPAKYSNGNYASLLSLIEVITQQSFEDYLKAKVLVPLGLNHTYFGRVNGTESEKNWADPHMVYEDGVRRKVDDKISSSDSVASAVMGMYSCTRDIAILYQSFFDALDNNSSIKTFEKALIERLFAFGPDKGFYSSLLNDGEVGYTACGLVANFDSTYLGSHSFNRLMLGEDSSSSFSLGKGKNFRDKIYYQAGTVTGFGCCTYIIPHTFEAVIVMTNTQGLNDASDQVSRLILQRRYELKAAHENVDMVAKSERSAVETLTRLNEIRVRNPPNIAPIRDPQRLVGEYKGEYDAQHLIITTENDQTAVVVSDGRSNKSGKLGFASQGPKLFRIIPQSPGVDVFGSWSGLSLEDISPDDAQTVTHLSRKRPAINGKGEDQYVYERMRIHS